MTPSSTETPRTVSYFPVQKEIPNTVMAALLLGKLEIDNDGYLRVNDAMVLWPYGYSYKVEGDETIIIDERSNVAARVGEEVSIGGGYLPEYIVDEKLVQPLPKKNIGPFWLAAPLNYYVPTTYTTQ